MDGHIAVVNVSSDLVLANLSTAGGAGAIGYDPARGEIWYAPASLQSDHRHFGLQLQCYGHPVGPLERSFDGRGHSAPRDVRRRVVNQRERILRTHLSAGRQHISLAVVATPAQSSTTQ